MCVLVSLGDFKIQNYQKPRTGNELNLTVITIIIMKKIFDQLIGLKQILLWDYLNEWQY